MRRHGRALVVGVLCCVAVFVLVVAQRSTGPERAAQEGPPAEESQRSSRKRVLSADERDETLARAQIWRRPQVPVSEAYLGQDSSAPRELDCTFKLNHPSWTTPKVDCVTAEGEEIRIKYGVGGELPGEAATTRLLAALGFGADSITLIERLRCFGCPKEPFTVMKLVATTGTDDLYQHVINEESYEVFQWVALERRFPALAIDVTDGTEGWAFFELDKVDSSKGAAPRAHVDALRLLAVFLAHWDNKSENQRLVCLSEEWPEGTRCPKPFLLLQDVGSTFGPRRVDLEDWERAPIWKDRVTCTITMRELPVKGATFGEVRVGDEGRRFLSGLLDELTDVQLADLFSGARFDKRRGPFAPSSDVEEWVRAFKARRAAIAEGPACPPL
jgi:hypothetical protein